MRTQFGEVVDLLCLSNEKNYNFYLSFVSTKTMESTISNLVTLRHISTLLYSMFRKSFLPDMDHRCSLEEYWREPTWPQLGASNSCSWGIKSTHRPFSASPPSPFCRLTCLIDHAFSPHCRPVISTMYIFGTPILEAFDLQTERNKVMERRRW